MEIEKQRGISVATSVMGFNYGDYKINILDTPGHQDFAEDTYRTLTAVDSVIIVVDVAKGVETQTRKLMEVCRMRNTPVIVFVNKLDREGRDPFDILDELEAELKINVRPLSWPINIGQKFKGVYNIYEQNLNLFTPNKQVVTERIELTDVNSPELETYIGEQDAEKLRADLELVEGVYPEFNTEDYLAAKMAPVFFRLGTKYVRSKRIARLLCENSACTQTHSSGRKSRPTRRGKLHRVRIQNTRQHGSQSSQLYRFRKSMLWKIRTKCQLQACAQ